MQLLAVRATSAEVEAPIEELERGAPRGLVRLHSLFDVGRDQGADRRPPPGRQDLCPSNGLAIKVDRKVLFCCH
jgi:hypothetical protein